MYARHWINLNDKFVRKMYGFMERAMHIKCTNVVEMCSSPSVVFILVWMKQCIHWTKSHTSCDNALALINFLQDVF